MSPASLRGQLGCRLILQLLQQLHRRRIPALPCTSSPEAGEASGSSLWIPHLLLEQHVLVAVPCVQLEPLPISQNKCGTEAPLDLRPAVCWRRLAGPLFRLLEGVWVCQCADPPCQGHRFLGSCRMQWGAAIQLLAHSPRTAPIFPPQGCRPPARWAACPWEQSPRTPSFLQARARC